MTAPRIFGWSADYSGCGFYRMVMPLREYAARGGSAEWSTDMPAWVREGADVVIGQRVCLDGATRHWRDLKAAGRVKLVLELDDDLWTVDSSNRSAAATYTPERLDNLRANIRISDVVTVSTEPLADVVRPLNSNVVVVPNRIPAWLLEHGRPVADRITVGWAGSGSHEMDWADAGPQVGRFLKRNSLIGAHLIGASFRSMHTWPKDQVRTTNWAQSVEAYYRLLDFDIGLAPLRPHVFNRSKSAIKALEYAALETPTIASDAGPYAGFVRHGETGLLVRRDHEWGSHLHSLTKDPAMRREMGQRAHQLAAEHTIEDNLGDWLAAWGVDVPAAVAA